MKRFAVAAVVVVLSGMKADAQFFDAGPLYHTPSYAANAIGRYYPVSASGFYMQQPSGFGLVNATTGAVPPTFFPGGVVAANPYTPGFLYNDAVYQSIYSISPVPNPSYFNSPMYTYRPGLTYRYP